MRKISRVILAVQDLYIDYLEVYQFNELKNGMNLLALSLQIIYSNRVVSAHSVYNLNGIFKKENIVIVFTAFPFGLDLAAINIQRGRDHGLPAYTAWREPCGLTAIKDWDDLERVVGPKSAHRMRLAYKSIDDIDLFVGGLAERPVVGGLVGPVFACVIAQQFSNLRKGDRFWYENGDFESSFTPAQLQSIRQVNLAQVVCRALNSGTLQPHIFLPHTVSTNERQLCGTGSLTPIDLRPWLERDPFLKKTQNSNHSLDEQLPKPLHIQSTNDKIIINVDLQSASNPTIDIRQQNEPFSVNGTIINNKLDLDATRGHGIISNRLTNELTKNKINTRPKTQTNKKPKTTTTTKRPTTKRTKKRNDKNQNRHKKHKRDVTYDKLDHDHDNDNKSTLKARSSIVIKIDKPTDDTTSTQKSPFNGLNSKRRIDYKDDIRKSPSKEYVIVTPDQNAYDIEIKIKPKPMKNEKIVVDTNENDQPTNVQQTYYNGFHATTKRPTQQFYQVVQPSFSVGQYGGGVSAVQDTIIKPQKPTNNYDTYETVYNGLIVKRTTTKTITTTSTSTTRRPYVYNVQTNDEYTSKPYYITKRPYFGYGSNGPIQQNDNKPFYSYPSVQNTDTSYYSSSSSNDNSNNNNNNDDFVSTIQNSNPYQTKPQYDSPYLNRPSGSQPSLINNNYGQLDDDHIQNVRPQNSNYGPIYLDDFSTKPPDKLTTTFIVHGDDDEYFDTGYGSITTNRPHDLTTFYTVQTTRKRKQTLRPTRPTRATRPPTRPNRPAYGQNDDDIDNDDDDNDDDDDENVNIGYFNPSSVFSNLVNTFNGYFGSASTTTTRKPYITQQDNDEEENFYNYPSLPSHDFPYSRQPADNEDNTNKKRTRIKRFSDLNDDYEQTTYPAALNVNYNNDDDDDVVDNSDDSAMIAFDRDGYLRPEYMNFDSHKKHTNAQLHLDANSNAPDDTNTYNTHMTSLHETTKATRHQPPKFGKYRVHHLLDGIFENIRNDKQIITINDNDRKNINTQTFHSEVSTFNQSIDLIPLNVLTKPER